MITKRDSTIWHNTCTYCERVIGLQYKCNTIHTCLANPHSTYNPRFVLYFRVPRRVQYGTIRTARMPIANRDILFTICKIFCYAPRFFTIWSTVRTIFPRGVIVSYWWKATIHHSATFQQFSFQYLGANLIYYRKKGYYLPKKQNRFIMAHFLF
jgi:hypothetical protein